MAAPLGVEQELLSTALDSGILLDELYSTLLRARSDDAASSKQRAISIIADLPPEDVYDFMQQLLDTAASGPRLRLPCSGLESEHSHSYEVPDSPQRLAPVLDQQFSPLLDSSKARGSKDPYRDDEDVQQLPDSPVLHLQIESNPVQLQKLPQQHSSSGRCFVAESLDLNMGASYDWLWKASLADFSSAARLSTTGLAGVRQSHMRVLSPVEEASFLSAPADTQQGVILEDSASLLKSQATTQQAHYSLPGSWQPGQEAAHSCRAHMPGLRLSDTAEADMSPSTCSSPRDPAAPPGPPAAAASSWGAPATATALCVSVAESAHGWPHSQPVPVEVQDLAEEEPAQQALAHIQQAAAAAAAAAAGDVTAASCFAAAQGTATPVVHVQPQHRAAGDARVPDAANAPAAGRAAPCGASDGSSSSSSGVAAKRGGGPTTLGLIKAPLHGANALRRSIGRLWGGKGAGQKPKEPAAAAPPSSSSSKQPARSLACASAPMAAVYGRPSKLPSARQTPSSAVQPPLRGFSVTQKGSSPTKAAAAAVAAAAGTARKPSVAAARPGSSTPSQRPGSSISYRPPSAAARGAAAADLKPSLGKGDAAFGTPSRAAATSRIPVQSPGVATPSNGSGRMGAAAPTSRMLQQQAQQQQQRGAHGAAYDRPSSQASVSSYARSDATFTATGSHTSGGPFQGGFQATHKALGEKKTPTLKQPASRLQYKQHQQLAPGAAAQAGSSRIGRGPTGPSNPFSQQSTHSTATQHVSYPSSRLPAAAAAHGTSQYREHVTAFGGRSQLPAAPGAAHHSRGRGSSSSSNMDGRSQLRRSRSCGSLAEIFDVAELLNLWHQREQQAVTTQQPAAAHRVPVAAAQDVRGLAQQHSSHCAGGAARPAGTLQAQSSIGRGFGRQPAPGPAAAAAGDVYGVDPWLPMLSRCQSPTRSAEHNREQQVGASMVLARMGNVIGHVDALLAGDAANTAAAAAGLSAGTAHAAAAAQAAAAGGGEPSMPQHRQLGGPLPAIATDAAGTGHAPSPLVYKLVKGAQGIAACSAAAAAATPDRHAAHSAGGGVGLGQQQMLMTPPAQLPGVPDLGVGRSCMPGALLESTGSAGADWGPGGVDKWAAEGSLEASPAVSPHMSARSRQVPQSTGGLPHYMYTAPPAVSAGSSADGSQDLSMSHQGHDSNQHRQLF